MARTNSRIRITTSIFVISFLLLLLAVILQFISRHFIHDTDVSTTTNTTVGPDVVSALRRIKTEQCRQEIVNFVQQHQHRQEQPRRSCPLDSRAVERVVRLGCSSEVAVTNLTKLTSSKLSFLVELDDNQATDANSCNQLCYSFGHAFASFNYNLHRCLCADDGIFEFYKLKPCDGSIAATNPVQLTWFRVNNGIYYPTEQPNLSHESRGIQIRIAFLLSLNGRSTLQVLRLLKRIYSPKHLYYIHIDKKQKFLSEELRSHLSDYDNIHFSSQRLETIWGGTALLSMIINAMEDLSKHPWNYLINLSESDFPIRNLSELETYLSESCHSSIYLRSHNTKGYHFIKKQGLNYDFYQCEGRVWRLDKRKLPGEIIYTGGSDWFGLPRNFCNHIIENRTRPGSLVHSLLQIFNYTLLSAESFFHTLAQNGEFCDRLVDNNLRVTNWYRKRGCKCQHERVVDWCGCSPSIYRWTDSTRLKRAASNTAIFFSRKFDPTLSNSIIGFVEAHMLDRSVDSIFIDTRYWLNSFDSNHDVLPGFVRRFGELAVGQIKPTIHNPSIKSIHKFFNQDRFRGHIFEYCNDKSCAELLVTSRVANHWVKIEKNCFNNNLDLKTLEVNQDFDTTEMLFRGHDPLNPLSDIVVHHEWIVRQSNNSNYENVNFKWINPVGEVELIQDAKLKTLSTANQLSLVHRLNKRKPFSPGLWRLILAREDIDCLEYEFLVFDTKPYGSHNPSQAEFDKFYQVSPGCENGRKPNEDSSCNSIDWSLMMKDSLLEKYRL